MEHSYILLCSGSYSVFLRSYLRSSCSYFWSHSYSLMNKLLKNFRLSQNTFWKPLGFWFKVICFSFRFGHCFAAGSSNVVSFDMVEQLMGRHFHISWLHRWQLHETSTILHDQMFNWTFRFSSVCFHSQLQIFPDFRLGYIASWQVFALYLSQ